jgi:hypothetical protein
MSVIEMLYRCLNERAREKHDTNIIYLKVDPFWDDVRSDPRFRASSVVWV